MERDGDAGDRGRMERDLDARGRGPAEVDLDAAVARVASGELLAYPTETVWGLAADARSDAAVAELWRFKGRDSDAPVSILVSGAEALEPLGFAPGESAQRALSALWPGPLTAVLPCRGRFAAGVARADGAVGLRCSPHPDAAALAQACDRAGAGPVTATSCNRSGEPAAADRAAARSVCGDAVALLAGGDAGGGEPSTVVDFTGPRPRVLRWGGVDKTALASLLGELEAA